MILNPVSSALINFVEFCQRVSCLSAGTNSVNIIISQLGIPMVRSCILKVLSAFQAGIPTTLQHLSHIIFMSPTNQVARIAARWIITEMQYENSTGEPYIVSDLVSNSMSASKPIYSRDTELSISVNGLWPRPGPASIRPSTSINLVVDSLSKSSSRSRHIGIIPTKEVMRYSLLR